MVSVTDPTALNQYFTSKVLELGFSDYAFMPVSTDVKDLDRLQTWIEKKYHGPLEYMEQTASLRRDITSRLPGAKTVCILVQNYFQGDDTDVFHQEPNSSVAKVSRYAWGKDYHNVFRKRFDKLRRALYRDLDGAFELSVFSDAQPVMERAWANASGLGFVGKSSMFIHQKYGTWTFLAGFVTNLEIAPRFGKIEADHCGTCTACIDACPTNAILEPFIVDARKCISTWTVEKPFDDSGDDIVQGNQWAVGCDICQEVCPWNRFETVTSETRFMPIKGHTHLDHTSIATLDLSGTPLKRPKTSGLLRNIERATQVNNNSQ